MQHSLHRRLPDTRSHTCCDSYRQLAIAGRPLSAASAWSAACRHSASAPGVRLQASEPGDRLRRQRKVFGDAHPGRRGQVRACVARNAACCPGCPPADAQHPSALPLRSQRALSGSVAARAPGSTTAKCSLRRVSESHTWRRCAPTPQTPHACSPRARPPGRPTAPSQSCCVAVWHAGCRRPMRGHAAPGPHSYATMTQCSARAWHGQI